MIESLLHAEILAAAERLLIDTGDESALSTRAVVEAVGVTPPSMYLHFRDRADLVFAVCEEQFGHLDAAMQRAGEGIAEPRADGGARPCIRRVRARQPRAVPRADDGSPRLHA